MSNADGHSAPEDRPAAPNTASRNPGAERAKAIAEARRSASSAKERVDGTQGESVADCNGTALEPIDTDSPARASSVVFSLAVDGDAERLRSRQRAVELRPRLIEEIVGIAFGPPGKLKLAAGLALIGIAEGISPLAPASKTRVEVERTTQLPDGTTLRERATGDAPSPSSGPAKPKRAPGVLPDSFSFDR